MRAPLILVAGLLCGACAGSIGEPSARKSYTGQYSAVVIESTVTTSLQGGGTFSCTNTYTMSGTLTINIDDSRGISSGNAVINGSQTETAHSSGDSCKAKGSLSTSWSPTLILSGNDVHFEGQNLSTNVGYAVTSKTTFTGTLANGVITGALGFSASGSGVIATFSSVIQNYSTSMNVTLTQ